MIKFLKWVSTPIDMIINKVANGKMEDVIWSALTCYECKTKGMSGKGKSNCPCFSPKAKE